MISRIRELLKQDVWRIRAKSLPAYKAVPLKGLRILLISLRALTVDEVQLRASSLTFFSLLSVVPLLAMFFGIAKGFGLEQTLEQVLHERIQGQDEVLSFIITFAHNYLEKTKGGVIAGIGVALLFWSIIKVLGDIESAFNIIWGVKVGRSLYRKISDYLSVCLVAPFLFITASAATVLIASEAKTLTDKIAFLETFNPGITLLLKLLPLCAIWILFSFLYVFMPNTKVRFRCGILAGVLAGTGFQVFQQLYISLQIGLAKYNAIYGGFAALPFFVVWLQLSWFIVLVGAQISHATQKVDDYELEPSSKAISLRLKRVTTLLVVRFLVKAFCTGRPAVARETIIHELDLPNALVDRILRELLEAHLIAEVKLNGEAEDGYQIAADPARLTIRSVVDALDRKGNEDIPLPRTEDLAKIEDSLSALDHLIEHAPENRVLKDL
ncbi:MAG: YihY/virulence factor BrkB family protein [Syntrophobacteraceae bacterium]